MQLVLKVVYPAQADLCGAVDVDPTIGSLLGQVPAYLCVRGLRGSAQFPTLQQSFFKRRYFEISVHAKNHILSCHMSYESYESYYIMHIMSYWSLYCVAYS